MLIGILQFDSWVHPEEMTHPLRGKPGTDLRRWSSQAGVSISIEKWFALRMNSLILRRNTDPYERKTHDTSVKTPTKRCAGGSSCCDRTHSFTRRKSRSRAACICVT